MRRDLMFYYDADVQSVYHAFLTAAKNEPFRKDCKEEPFHTFTFGLNFSMKYNMNGGAVTMHFIPYKNGTAVDMRFSIAQAGGARYGRYAEDLNKYAAQNLGRAGQPITLDIEVFLDPANQVVAGAPAAKPTFTAQQPAVAQPVIKVEPVDEAVIEVQQPEIKAAQPAAKQLCVGCGAELKPGALFCTQCGKKIAPVGKFCTNCGAKVSEAAKFCTQCGNKL